jgi:acetate---CoA ligase (ADP-forming)
VESNDLTPLFRPRTIAVVGASAKPGKAGSALLAALAGFGGSLYPVHPSATAISGRRAYPSVSAVGADIDLAILTVPAGAVPGVLEDCVTAGVRAAIVCAGGFAESGAGAELQQKVADIVADSRLRLLGPNTSGFVNPVDSVIATFVAPAARIPAGDVAIVSCSGGVSLATAFHAAGERLGVRLAVGLGNCVDVQIADVVDFLSDDPHTAVIGLQIEGVADGRALCAAIERASRSKPVVAYKVGRTDVEQFAKSHTGALLGDYALACAALRQSGAVLAEDLTGLIDALRALRVRRAAPRRRAGVGVVTGQAGPGIIIADTVSDAGASVPPLNDATMNRIGQLLPPLTWMGNPVDTGRPSPQFSQVLRAVADDPAVDVLAVYMLDEPDAVVPSEAFTAAGILESLPVVFGTAGPPGSTEAQAKALAPHGVPLYPTPERAARAAVALAQDSEARWRLTQSPPPTSRPARTLAPAVAQPDEHEAKELLTALGVPTMPRVACANRASALAALRALGGPVVVKLLHPEVLHKSDVGGVHLGIENEAALNAALDSIDRIPLTGPRRYLVERQAAPGVELIVGGLRDESFGPVVALGPGGISVELAARPRVQLAPLTRQVAEDLVAALPAAVLHGSRGARPLARQAVVDVLLAVSDLLVGHPAITEVDINPLRLTTDGVVALDALIVTDA